MPPRPSPAAGSTPGSTTPSRHDPDLAVLVAIVQRHGRRRSRSGSTGTPGSRSDVSHELRSPLTTLSRGDRGAGQRRATRCPSAAAGRARPACRSTSNASPSSSRTCSRSPGSTPARSASSSTRSASCQLVQIDGRRTSSHGGVPVDVDPELERRRRRGRQTTARSHPRQPTSNNAEKYADGATGVFVERVEPDRRAMVQTDGAHQRRGRRPRRARGRARPDLRPLQPRRPGRIAQHRRRRRPRASPLAAEHARLQGGSVWVEDRHDGGRGARFVVELPLVEPDDMHDEDDLSLASPEAASALTLTGEHPRSRSTEEPSGRRQPRTPEDRRAIDDRPGPTRSCPEPGRVMATSAIAREHRIR